MTATASTSGNDGTTVSTAEDVRATPSAPSPSSHTPLMTIISAVIVQITMVSMNGSSSATWPSVEGSLVLTAEWAIEAEPMPASLEKAARWNPTMSTPTTPPLMTSGLNEPETMSPKAPGTFSRFARMTTRQASR